MTLAGIAAQAAAFLRTAIIAALLGVSPAVDAYNLGLIAPIFASTVIGAWLQLSFVGRYTELVGKEADEELAAAFLGRMLVLVLAGALLLTTVCVAMPRQIAQLLIPSLRPDMANSVAAALQPAALILIPIIIGDFLSLVLNVHRRFFVAAAAPIANGLVSGAALLLWPSPDLTALVWTLVAGSIAQCLIVVAAVWRMRLRFVIWKGNATPEIRRALLLALPALPTAMLVNAAPPILQFSAAQLGEGAVAIYGYATRLHGSISQLLMMGLSTVLLPHFAALWSREQKDEILSVFRRIARCTVLAVAYLTVGIFLMGETAIQILLQRGAFVEAQTVQVNATWFILSLSLFPYVFGTFIAKFCQAVGDARSLLVSSIMLLASTWIAVKFSSSWGSISAVATAFTASFMVTYFYWSAWLSRRIVSGPIFRDIALSILRCGLILAPAAIITQSFRLAATSAIVDLACRGTLYTASALLLFVATRSYGWFLAREPDRMPGND